MTKGQRQFRAQAAAALAPMGAEVLDYVNGGKHPRLRVKAPNGETFFVVVASSASCVRAARNTISDIKRMIREKSA